MNVEGGTGGKAQIGCPAAGKTGTTDKHSDAWFVGFTPKLATAVWVGYPKAQIYMTTEYHGGSVAGGTFPAEIWGDYMKTAKGKFCGGFPPPTEPLSFTKFFGKYASGRSNTGSSGYDQYGNQYPPSTGGTAPSPTTAPEADGDGEAGGGSTGDDDAGKQQDFDPELYESPPQKDPASPEGGASPPGDG
jgi:penicillin-binding protein 1A